jgi:hypothetical protein
MQITRNGMDTTAGPREWFTGAVYIDPVATPSGWRGAKSLHDPPRDARGRRRRQPGDLG